MEKKFQSRRTWWFGLIFWFSILVSIYAIFKMFAVINSENWLTLIIPFILMFLTAGLLLWIWLGTSYKVTESHIFYYSGPIRGKISLDKLRKIEVAKTMWTGLRPALATKGLILHYGNYDMIYISPEDNQSFIDYIRRIRPEIVFENRMFT